MFIAMLEYILEFYSSFLFSSNFNLKKLKNFQFSFFFPRLYCLQLNTMNCNCWTENNSFHSIYLMFILTIILTYIFPLSIFKYLYFSKQKYPLALAYSHLLVSMTLLIAYGILVCIQIWEEGEELLHSSSLKFFSSVCSLSVWNAMFLFFYLKTINQI